MVMYGVLGQATMRLDLPDGCMLCFDPQQTSLDKIQQVVRSMGTFYPGWSMQLSEEDPISVQFRFPAGVVQFCKSHLQ